MTTAQPHFSISQLARDLQITTRTIRYYEERGLITPQRSDAGTRYYTRKNRARLKLILRGKRFGFQLHEIKEMITLFDDDPSERTQLRQTIAYGEKKLEDIDEQISELQRLRAEIVAYKQSFEQKLETLEHKQSS